MTTRIPSRLLALAAHRRLSQEGLGTAYRSDWLAPGEAIALDEAGHLLIVSAAGAPMRAERRPAPPPEWLHVQAVAPVVAGDLRAGPRRWLAQAARALLAPPALAR